MQTYYSGRVARIVLLAGGTLKKEDGTAYILADYFQVVADFLTANGYTIKDNGWGITEGTIGG